MLRDGEKEEIKQAYRKSYHQVLDRVNLVFLHNLGNEEDHKG